MREYAIVRQHPGFKDMIALPFISDLSELAIEVINPEWTEGAYLSGATEAAVNSPTSNANMKLGKYFNDKYDMVIIPISRKVIGGNVYSGTRASTDTGTLVAYVASIHSSVNKTYMLISNAKNNYLYISEAIDDASPVLGVIVPSGITPILNIAPIDDMRSDENPAPDPDDVKDAPTEPEPEPEPEKK